jgi:hypothetical protein
MMGHTVDTTLVFHGSFSKLLLNQRKKRAKILLLSGLLDHVVLTRLHTGQGEG